MISPSIARAHTTNAIQLLAAQRHAEDLAAEQERARVLAEIEAMRPERTRALNIRIDAAVDRYISEVVEPAIVAAAQKCNTYAAFSECRWWNDSDPLGAIITDEFDNDAAGLIHLSSLARHRVAWWAGRRAAYRDVSMQYHILYRVGVKLQTLGYSVELPVIVNRTGCKVDQEFRPLGIRW